MQELEPLEPVEAIEQYLSSREQDATKSTIQNHRYRLKQFRIWAEENGLENLNNLTGRRIEEFKNWRISEGGINAVTLEQHLRTIRVFTRYCESIDAVEKGTSDKIIVPRLSKGEKVREEFVDEESAEEIISYLRKYEYATRSHIIFHLLWHTGMRRGALNSLDLEDWNSKEGYLSVHHRPETGTPLKLGEEGERNITIANGSLAEALDDYIENNRHSTEDDSGRDPLLTSRNGRLHGTSIQHHVYKVTRPCFYSGECPHNEEIDSCEHNYAQGYSSCPSSLSPHPIRRGAITAHLDNDVPKEIASERMSVSVDTLEKHYDARDKEQKRLNRKKHLSNL